jgi:Flp pilus assembly protein TadD
MAGLRRLVMPFLLLALVGCDATLQERLRFYNEDGIHQFSQGNYQQACDSFEQALVLKPDDPVLIFNLGQAYDRLGETARAETYYQESLRRDKTLADARQAYANLLVRTDRAPEAHRLIDNWTREGQGSADALVLEAWKLRQDKNYPSAYEKLQQALALEPHNSRALTELGVLYERMNLPERSLVLYERVLEINPNLFEVRERMEQLKQRGIARPLPAQ